MKHLPNPNNVETKTRVVVSTNHTKASDDDCGLPTDPVFADYVDELWQGHSENRRMRRLSRASERNDGRDQR